MAAKKALSPLKAKPLRNPGQSLDDQIIDLVNDKILPAYVIASLLVTVAAIEWFAYWRNVPRNPVIWTLAACLAIAYCVWLSCRMIPHARRLKLGRDGERVVGQFLDGLRESGARIFHDIAGDGFNIDHVVVSQRGIFVVETKTLSKPNSRAKIVIDGEELLVAGRKMKRNPIQQVRAQVTWLARFLKESTGKSFPIRGSVVFPGWFIEPPPRGSKLDIWILEPKALPAFIEHEPMRLAAEDVALAAYHLAQYIRNR